MVDWAGHAGQRTDWRYRVMAERQLRGVSPTYERLCLGVAGDAEMLARLDTLAPPKRQPNLLLGAVRYLGGPIGSYPEFRAFVLDGWPTVEATLLSHRTQTNEPRRCAVLLPVLAALQQPLALLEVGAAAGLCLYPDRYAYRYDGGPVLGDSPLVLDCATRGPAPIPAAPPTVAWRAGLDIHPLEVRDDEDVRWLESLIWPEQIERVETFRQAVAQARTDPVAVRRGDLTTDLASVAADAPADATLVVYHSAVLAYLTDEQRADFRAEVAALAAQRPVVWVSNEGPGVVVDVPVPDGPVLGGFAASDAQSLGSSEQARSTSLTREPFVLARDGVPLAYTHPHGFELDWLT